MALTHEIQAFYPNWLSPDLYLSLRYDLLTTVCWHGIKALPDGTLHKEIYPPSQLIQMAHANGVKVVPVLFTDFGSDTIDTILSNTTIQDLMIGNLVSEINVNGFDGIDVDLEGFTATNKITGQSNRTLYTQFIQNLRNRLGNSKRISIDLPAVDWENTFNVGTLQNSCNFLMIMGYDYHWQGGPTAGSVSPLNNNSSPSVTNSVNTYSGLMNKSKLLLGVPYYGYEWPTVSNQREAATTAPGTVIQYKDTAAKVAAYGRSFDSVWKTPYYMYGQWNQGHFDDVESLGYKYDLVNQNALAGIGIWALGYDGGATELWNLISSKFTSAAMTCSFTYTQ